MTQGECEVWSLVKRIASENRNGAGAVGHPQTFAQVPHVAWILRCRAHAKHSQGHFLSDIQVLQQEKHK